MGANHSYHPVSPWKTGNDLDELLAELEPGDALEFSRGITYSHCGVYVGYRSINGSSKAHYVVHLSSPEDANSKTVFFASGSSNKRDHGLGGVDFDPVEKILGGDKVRINNSLDATIEPYGNDTIVGRALDALDEDYPEYNVLTNNCEHFVNWIRNGVRKSSQVEQAPNRLIELPARAVFQVSAPNNFMS